MKNKNNIKKSLIEDRKTILEMINASMELAKRLGEHRLKKGCNCISCVNKRKRLIETRNINWKFVL